METPVSSPTPIFLLRAAALRTESHHHPTLLKFTTEHLSGGLSTTFPSGWGGLMRLVDKWNLALIICVCVCVCLFFFKLWYPPSFLFLMDLLLFYLFFCLLVKPFKSCKKCHPEMLCHECIFYLFKYSLTTRDNFVPQGTSDSSLWWHFSLSWCEKRGCCMNLADGDPGCC